MGEERTEACGRCAMTTVVDAATDGEEEGGLRDPFDGERIEIDDRELRVASAPAIFAGRVKRRIDEIATRIVYG